MKTLIASLGQILFPNLCVCCYEYLSQQEESICDLCLFTLPIFELGYQKDNPLARKFWGRLNVEIAFAHLVYKSTTNVKQLLNELKYNGNITLGIEMGKWLGDALLKSKQFTKIDYIIPIPLHPTRQKFRGYNQSELLGQGVSQVMNIPMLTDIVARERYNKTQTKKRRYERYINSQELFRVRIPEQIEGKHILLLDDVITTGSTMESCGEVLLDVNNLTLSLASLAVAT